MGTVAIAPLDEALTFARARPGAGPRIIAVTSYRDGTIGGTDLTPFAEHAEDDAIDLLNRLGHARLATEIPGSAARVEMAAADLDLPVDLLPVHVAVGTNYPDHADEATVKGGPFLFPKMVAPTPARAAIPAGEALLDYEVELALVPIRPLAPGDAAAGGLLLCNDVTDRALLMRHVDPRNPQSGRGFTTGKSAPGYLPVGDLFVVPRDLDTFLAKLTLQLSVNGAERQRGPVTQWIWDFDDMLREARGRRGTAWSHEGGEARLPFDRGGALPARTLLMAGTPAGTVFKGVSAADYLGGIAGWLLRAGRKPVVDCVIERYIARARSERIYLQPGDEVTIRVHGMGMLANTVAAG
jgi:2-keto-4-pentenoate hydratase/2-oxohepta-3-ene-1,7-dioic acid hydratase in catechol pathway